ncbi:MAG: hypothetical protein HRT74_12135 [Flavobacteriales bacterium]|nr:hypothetical protein [Flavobacteriales bacterium]
MRSIIVILVISVLPILCNGQVTWKYIDTPFQITVFAEDTALNETAKGRFVNRIEILRSDTLFQIIKPEQYIHEAVLDSSSIFKHVDLNFDGVKDLQLVNWFSSHLHSTSWCWLYDHEQDKFLLDESLSSITNLQADQEKKCIYSYWRIGFHEEGHAIYQWEKGNFVLQIEEFLTWGLDPDKPGLCQLTRKTNQGLITNETEITEDIVLSKERLYLLLGW